MMRPGCLVILLLTARLVFAQHVAVETYTAVPITETLYLMQVPANPMYDNMLVSAGPDGLLMVDNGYPETVDNVRSLLNELGDAPPMLIINTHFHHGGANDAFGQETTIIAHHTVRARMQREVLMYGQMPIGPWTSAGLPDLTFDSTLTVHFNNDTLRLLHFPEAHTDGDVVVFFEKANVVVTGDLFVPSLGVCDLANGCRWDAFLEGMRRLLELVPRDAVIVPGHGPLSTYEDLEAAYAMLTDVTAYVQRQIDAGKSVDAVIATGLPERWQGWEERGLSAEFFLTNVYEGLSRR